MNVVNLGFKDYNNNDSKILCFHLNSSILNYIKRYSECHDGNSTNGQGCNCRLYKNSTSDSKASH